MARRKRRGGFNGVEVLELLKEKPTLLFIIPLILVCWVIERWFFTLSNWVPLVVGIWATYQYCSHRHAILVEEMESKWKRVVLSTSPITPLEHCEWLNKLLNEFWLNYMNPKFSSRFASLVEKRLKQHRSKLIERVELLEFSLGSCPPSLGLQGARWSTYGDQRILRMGFEWDTTDMSVLLLAKLAMGTARIVINSLHIKGDLLFMPILDGRAMLFSFVSSPEVRIGVAFGSGGSQSVPATELPGVSSWLVKVFTDTLAKTMVEPRRRCLHLPAVDLRRKAVGGSIHVTVVSASKLSKNSIKASPSRKLSSSNGFSEENFDDKDLNTFVEVEIEKLSRRTEAKRGSSPIWNSAFNMVLHEDTGILRFHLYNCNPNSVNYDHLASCEIKMRYNADDSTTFWAIGPDSGVIARFAEFCGKEVEMVVPFEGNNAGELKVKLVMKEWQFSGGDGSYSSDKTHLRSLNSTFGSSDLFPRTGRKIYVAVKEGKDLPLKERSGKCEPYVKLQYGKAYKRTRTASGPNPIWNQRFEFDEIGGGEYLKIRCHHEETFGNENIGSAQVSLEGLADGSIRDVWIPLEKVNSGELRLQMEAVRVDDYEASRGSHVGSSNGWIELVIVEARDLVAADLRGTSDPYVRVRYGSWKKRTKVMYKTLNPRWNQTLEFPDDGSPLELYVKDHNALLPTSSIGDCVVEYQGLPPNQSYDKWIPLQGVKKGEIHVQITRKVAELQKRSSLDSEGSSSKSREISAQMKRTINKIQSLVDEEDTEELLIALGELEGLEEMQEEYVVQLETEQMLLLNKIKELGKELLGPSSPSFHRNSSGI